MGTQAGFEGRRGFGQIAEGEIVMEGFPYAILKR